MRAILNALMLFVSIPAWADWQYTKWGMTPDEVVQAAKSAGVTLTPKEPMPGKPKTTYFSAPYSNGVFDFSARFIFSAGNDPRLRTIALETDNHARCMELKGVLDALYGIPFKDSPGGKGVISFSSTEWHDAKANHRVTWTYIKDSSCSTYYSELQGTASKGL